MKMRSKRKIVLRYLPGKDCKHCELCHGAKGGVRGNNVIIDGKRVCDYCHVGMRAREYAKRTHADFVEKMNRAADLDDVPSVMIGKP